MQTPPNHDDLTNTLMRYEGAVSAVERDGDDSDAAVKEMEDAREALLTVLREARRAIIARPPFINSSGCESGRIQSSEPNFTEVERRPQHDHLPEGSY